LSVRPSSSESGAAVVPVSSSGSLAADPWQLLAQGEGIRIDWSPWTEATSSRQWGPTLSSTSAFARQLGAVTERAGAGAGAAGKTLFRLELPTGQTVQNLVPAVGGGFRGLLRAPGSPGIAGQARLIPVSGAAVGAGAGAVALGPLVAIMALSVGVEMLASREQDQKLKAIKDTVDGIEKHLQEELTAKLDTAEQALVAANAAVLDQASIPQSVGLPSAVTGLHDVKNQALAWLAQWEELTAKIGSPQGSVPFDKVAKVLDVGLGGRAAFPAHVMVLYRALALDSRAQALGAAEAALANPDRSMQNFESDLRHRLAANINHHERLRSFLSDLAEHPLSISLPANPISWRTVARYDRTIARLSRSVNMLPEPPALLTAQNTQVLEAVRNADGSFALLSPASVA
jgi:hypothetical protein